MLLTPHEVRPAHPDTDRLALWLGQVAQGDERAFFALYQATAAHLLGVALLLMKRRERAEEVLQESFVNVWDHAGQFVQTQASPMSWLISIVRHKALDHLRRSRYTDRHVSLDAGDGLAAHRVASDTADPLALLSAASARLGLETCLGSLEAPLRQSLALAYYEGLSHPEIAGRLQAPLGTVKTWLRRGIDRLRACLNNPESRR